MQYLKEEIRNRILDAALAEFKEKGFLDASMRSIAKNAGVALGNLYRYFKNKEQLFNTLMEPAYNSIMGCPDEQQKECCTDHIAHLETIADDIMRHLGKYKDHLLILLEKSQGTKFENSKQELVYFAENKLKEDFLPALNDIGVNIEDEYIFYLLASTLVEGFLIAIKKYDDEAKTRYLIRQLIYIYFYDILNRFK